MRRARHDGLESGGGLLAVVSVESAAAQAAQARIGRIGSGLRQAGWILAMVCDESAMPAGCDLCMS